MNAEEEKLHNFAHHVLRVVRGTEQHAARLEKTNVTVAMLLQGGITHDVDFATLDRTAKELDAAIKQHGAEHQVVAENDVHSLSGLRSLLMGAADLVEPYREARRA